jgi:adenine-specific DNA-methyltransferase
MARSPKGPKEVAALNHEADARRNIATAELADIQQMLEAQAPQPPAVYPRSRPLSQGEVRERDPDLDPQIIWNGARIRLTQDQIAKLSETGEIEIGDAQLVWRGKDRQDWSDLIVTAPPVYIQEKVHPKAIIDDLTRMSKASREATTDAPDLFADFNGLSDPMARTEFYQHDQHWSNRMILGDSLQVMASLAEREALKGKVQCIYFDPPYGIKFNSNWQVSTQSRDVKDGKQTDISREPEQVKAFRDTWKDGIHSYLTYLRDRLTVMRELLTESGSVFVQISDENVHRVRAVMDEVFGEENFLNEIPFVTTGGQSNLGLGKIFDIVVWYAKAKSTVKYRQLYEFKELRSGGGWAHSRIMAPGGLKLNLGKDQVRALVEKGDDVSPYYQDNLASQGATPEGSKAFRFEGRDYTPPANSHWKTHLTGMGRLAQASRIDASVNSIRYVRLLSDFSIEPINNIWDDTIRAGYIDQKRYVVETTDVDGPPLVRMVADF